VTHQVSLKQQVTLYRVNGEWHITELKTKKSRRTLPLPEPLEAVLKKRHKQQLEEKLKAGDRWIEKGLVFTTRHGKAVNPSTPNSHLNRILESAGLPPCRVHDLRHQAASILLAQGIISDVLGHADISTTANIYAHVMPTLKEQAIAALNRVLTAQG